MLYGIYITRAVNSLEQLHPNLDAYAEHVNITSIDGRTTLSSLATLSVILVLSVT